MSSEVLPEDREARRREAKALREQRKTAHPFDATQPQPQDQDLFDDAASAPVALVAIPGAADRLGIPAADFFDSIAGWPIRRIYVRGLAPSIGQPHSLGTSSADISASLKELTRDHDRVVYVGTSMGGFHALLFGTLTSANGIVAVNPITCLLPEFLHAAEDTRWDDVLAQTPPEWLREFGDISALWERIPAPPTFVHYPYRNRIYAVHAEHIAEWPHVQVRPHYEHSPMDVLHRTGRLRTLLGRLLWPNGVPQE